MGAQNIRCFFFRDHKKNDIFNKGDLKDLEELANLQPKVKQVRLVQKLGKQGFHYDIEKTI